MPRSPRVHAEGLLYHVMARGKDGQKYTSVSLNPTVRDPRLAHATPLSALREDHAADGFALRDLGEFVRP